MGRKGTKKADARRGANEPFASAAFVWAVGRALPRPDDDVHEHGSVLWDVSALADTRWNKWTARDAKRWNGRASDHETLRGMAGMIVYRIQHVPVGPARDAAAIRMARALFHYVRGLAPVDYFRETDAAFYETAAAKGRFVQQTNTLKDDQVLLALFTVVAKTVGCLPLADIRGTMKDQVCAARQQKTAGDQIAAAVGILGNLAIICTAKEAGNGDLAMYKEGDECERAAQLIGDLVAETFDSLVSST